MAEFGDRLVDTEVIHVLTLGVAPYAQPKFAQQLPAQRLLHRQQRARRRQRGTGRLHADFPLASAGAVPFSAHRDRRGPGHGQPAGRARQLQPGRLGGHHQGGGRVRQAGHRPGQPAHAAHPRRLLPPCPADRLPGRARRAAPRVAQGRRAGRGHPSDRDAPGPAGPRRGNAATRHRPDSRRGSRPADRQERPGHSHRDVLRRCDQARPERQHHRPVQDAEPGQDRRQLCRRQPRAVRVHGQQPA